MHRILRLGPILLLAAATFAQTQPATQDDIAPGDWATYNRNYRGDRYSPLEEITSKNVASLQPLCTYDSGEKTSFESAPVVVSGTLYFTTLENTYAIDAATCKLLWKQTEALGAERKKGLGVNRGAAYSDGKLFRGFDDGNVVAIEAKSGKVLWKTRIAGNPGETIPSAPL